VSHSRLCFADKKIKKKKKGQKNAKGIVLGCLKRLTVEHELLFSHVSEIISNFPSYKRKTKKE
jgi:hypothetical protein